MPTLSDVEVALSDVEVEKTGVPSLEVALDVLRYSLNMS